MVQSRQLAAIMFTDIAGYTALMGEDEQAAFDLLKTNRQIQRPLIDNYGGKWIKELGDGVLATFSNVTDAVLCAGAIQQRCMEIPHLKLRIGIHLGEVVFEDNDVFGDGVNIASRIQCIAPIGGIYISESVQKNLSNKKGITTRLIGEETFKNVSNPICLYEVTVDIVPEKIASPVPVVLITQKRRPIVEKSIAVMAFANMSNDPEQEYFSDGIAEEILNSLTRLKDLKVVARSSSFQYKNKNVSLQEIGEELGVTTILEGSIRKQGNRVRISTHLVNSAGGYNLWSERYDRQADDIFAIQDEIALAITEKLKVTFYQNEKQLINTVPTENLEAYELYLKGRYFWNKRGRYLANALPLFQQAIKIDPNFAKAYAGIADAYSSLGMYGIIHPKEAMPKAKAAAQKAIELDPTASEAFTSMGYINGIYENDRYLANKNFQLAIEKNPAYATGHAWYSFYLTVVENDLARAEKEGSIAIALEPYNAVTYHIAGLALLGQRRFAEALALADKAIEFDAALFLPYFLGGWCLIEMGNFQKAIEYLTISLNLSGRHSWALGFMAMAQARRGNMVAAEALFEEIKERDSTQFFSVLGSAIGASAVNNIEMAVYFLEKGFQNKDILIPIFPHLTVMPDNLRNDQRFLDFLKRTNLIDE